MHLSKLTQTAAKFCLAILAMAVFSLLTLQTALASTFIVERSSGEVYTKSTSSDLQLLTQIPSTLSNGAVINTAEKALVRMADENGYFVTLGQKSSLKITEQGPKLIYGSIKVEKLGSLSKPLNVQYNNYVAKFQGAPATAILFNSETLQSACLISGSLAINKRSKSVAELTNADYCAIFDRKKNEKTPIRLLNAQQRERLLSETSIQPASRFQATEPTIAAASKSIQNQTTMDSPDTNITLLAAEPEAFKQDSFKQESFQNDTLVNDLNKPTIELYKPETNDATDASLLQVEASKADYDELIAPELQQAERDLQALLMQPIASSAVNAPIQAIAVNKNKPVTTAEINSASRSNNSLLNDELKKRKNAVAANMSQTSAMQTATAQTPKVQQTQKAQQIQRSARKTIQTSVNNQKAIATKSTAKPLARPINKPNKVKQSQNKQAVKDQPAKKQTENNQVTKKRTTKKPTAKQKTALRPVPENVNPKAKPIIVGGPNDNAPSGYRLRPAPNSPKQSSSITAQRIAAKKAEEQKITRASNSSSNSTKNLRKTKDQSTNQAQNQTRNQTRSQTKNQATQSVKPTQTISASRNTKATPQVKRSAPVAKKISKPVVQRAISDGKKWMVVLNSTQDKSQARAVLARIRQKGFPAILTPFSKQGVTYYRVALYNLASRSKAKQWQTKAIKQLGIKDAWITQQ